MILLSHELPEQEHLMLYVLLQQLSPVNSELFDIVLITLHQPWLLLPVLPLLQRPLLSEAELEDGRL